MGGCGGHIEYVTHFMTMLASEQLCEVILGVRVGGVY